MAILEYPPESHPKETTPEGQVASDILIHTSHAGPDDIYHYWPDHMSEGFARGVQDELVRVGLHTAMREIRIDRDMEECSWGLDVSFSGNVIPFRRK